VKSKIYSTLCHEDILGSVGITPPFLSSVVVGGEWSASCPGHFTPREISLCSHWMGGWVGIRVSPDAVEKEKNLSMPGIEPRPSSL
jgi:hypothetical protein